MPHPPSQEPRTDKQPHARLEFSEYELQVLETITQHAIDGAAIRSDLIRVVATVQTKIKQGRADLAIARRRLAVANEQQPKREEPTDE